MQLSGSCKNFSNFKIFPSLEFKIIQNSLIIECKILCCFCVFILHWNLSFVQVLLLYCMLQKLFTIILLCFSLFYLSSWVRHCHFVFSLGCTVYSFCVGVYVISVLVTMWTKICSNYQIKPTWVVWLVYFYYCVHVQIPPIMIHNRMWTMTLTTYILMRQTDESISKSCAANSDMKRWI
jgi:hypothetical protein